MISSKGYVSLDNNGTERPITYTEKTRREPIPRESKIDIDIRNSRTVTTQAHITRASGLRSKLVTTILMTSGEKHDTDGN